MKLNIKAFAAAIGTVTAILFAVCAFFIAVAPEPTMAFFGYLLHVDLGGIARPISWGGFFAGLIATGLGTAFLGAAIAALYNRLSRE